MSTVSFWNSFNSFTPNVFITKEAIFSVFTLKRTRDNRCVLIGLNNWRWWSKNQWNRLMNYAWKRIDPRWWSEERSVISRGLPTMMCSEDDGFIKLVFSASTESTPYFGVWVGLSRDRVCPCKATGLFLDFYSSSEP